MSNVEFVCEVCGCVDITALAPAPVNGVQYLCSLHHPLSLKWHGEFSREAYNPNNDIVCNKPTGLGLS